MAAKEQLQPLDRNSDKLLIAKVIQIMQSELHMKDPDAQWHDRGRLYTALLPHMPAWVDHQVLAVHEKAVFLIGVDRDMEKAQLLAQTPGGVIVNTAKMDAYGEENTIYLWSQYPFGAREMNTTIQWTGNALLILSCTEQDPTAQYYTKMSRLLQEGDVEEAVRQEDYPQYPGSYEGYYAVPQLAIEKAHEYALQKHRDGDLHTAVRILKWGIDKYLEVQAFGPLSVEHLTSLRHLTEKPAGYGGAYRIELPRFAEILNDYAFLLAESGNLADAAAYLRKVLELAPQRAVAYINLADACWLLGEQDEARQHYARYLSLLSADAEIPPRVFERLDNSD